MLSYLAEYEATFGPLRLLRFITLRTLLAAMTALVIGFKIWGLVAIAMTALAAVPVVFATLILITVGK